MAELPLSLAGFYLRGFRRLRVAAGWERALHGAAGKAVLPMVLRHTAIQEHLLMASLELIGEQAAYQRKTLRIMCAQARHLQQSGLLAAADAADILKDLETTETQLAALERRATSGTAQTRSLVSETVQIAATKKLAKLRSVTSGRLTGLVTYVSQEVNPAMHAGLSRAFEAGPLGQRAWAVLADAIEMNPGQEFKRLMQYLGETLGASHPVYRQTISETSRVILGMGLQPVEVVGECYLLKASGAAEAKGFRDGVLLAVTEPAQGLTRAGEAAVAVTLESRQASMFAEAGDEAEKVIAAKNPWDRAKEAVKQQLDAPKRTDRAIETGSLLLTRDGELYRLRPTPTGYGTTLLVRPHMLPEEYVEKLAKATATSAGHPADVVQILPPYSSEQLRAYAGPLMRRVKEMLARVSAIE